jgi:hypothetical protein
LYYSVSGDKSVSGKSKGGGRGFLKNVSLGNLDQNSSNHVNIRGKAKTTYQIN